MFALSPLPRTLDAALRDLEHRSFPVRLSAVRDLARHGSGARRHEVERALVRALRHDEAPGIRSEAAVALADIGARSALDALVDAMADEHSRVRQMALLALGELGTSDERRIVDVVRGLLDDAQPELRYQSLVALFRLDPERAEPLLVGALRDRDEQIRYVSVRMAEEHYVGKGERSTRALPPQVMAGLTERLRDTSADVRLAAAIVLLKGDDRSGAQEIIAALNTPGAIRHLDDEQAAIELAGDFGLAEATPGLVRRAFGPFGPSRHAFSWHARVALAKLGDARARGSILRGLTSFFRDTRSAAVAAAGHAGLEEAREVIGGMLGDERRADQSAVEQALALLDNARSEACYS
jgi:HEAT repeat protein